MRHGIDKRAMALLSSGHLATDFANGALPALVPFFVAKWDLSYTLAGLTILAWAVSSSVVQPLFGLHSDRRGALWLLPAGLAAGGLGIGLAALAPSYWTMLALVVVSGLGTAAYHPEGAKFAAYASGARRASGMSIFSVGGNLGYALGPLVATALVLQFGLDGGALLAVPCLLSAAVLLAASPYLRTLASAPLARPAGDAPEQPRAVALLLTVIACRNVAWFALIAFVPLLEVARGHSEAYGNKLLAAMLLAGGIGTLFAGPAADRFGRRPVLLGSIAATGPLMLVYLFVGGLTGAVALAFLGASVIGTFGVSMVMSQEYMPRRIGMVSGLTLGLGIGLGGVASVVVGALGDAIGLERALHIAALAPFVALALGLRLPSSRRMLRAGEVVSPA